MFLVSLIVLVTTFGGKTDLLIMDTVEPESSSTLKIHLLLTAPIVSVVQIVIGHSQQGIAIFGP